MAMTQRSWGGGNQTGYLRMYQEVLGQSCGENYSYVRVRTYMRPNSTATFFNDAHRWYWGSWNNSGGAGYGINWTRTAGGHFSAGPRFHRRHTHDAEGNRTLSNATEARHPSVAGFQSRTVTRLPTSGYWEVGLPRIARVPNAPAAPTVTRVSIGDTLRASVNMPANNGAAVSHMAFQRRHLHPGGSWSGWGREAHVATGGTNPTTWDSVFATRGEQAQFRSRALNCRGWGPWSGASTAFTTSNTPAQVAAPTHSMNRETNIATVNWTNPADRGAAITGYRWERQERGGTANGTPSFTGTVGGAARTFSMPGAVGNGREVRWRIQAINARGNGDWSAWTGWLAAGDVPVRPNPNAAIAINQTTNVATATFTNPGNNGAALTQRRWRFEVAGTVGPWSAWTAIATTTATVGVGNGQSVRVMQQVRNARGDSAEGDWTGTVTGGVAPSQVATPTLTAGNVGQMSASWTAPATGGAPITGYRWELRRVGQSALTASGTATATSVTMSVPGGGVEYEFRVRAESARGQGAWSAWSRATSAASLPGAPSGVSATASINAQGALIVALAWTNNPEPLSPYQALMIQRRDNVNAQWVAVATLGPAVTSHSTAAQTPLDRLFEYRVVATNSRGQAASGVVGPFASEPLSPTAGALSVRGDLTIAVRWQSSSTYRAQQRFEIRNGQTAPVGTGGVVVGTISAPAALVSEANGVSTYEFVVGRDGGSAMPNPAVLNSYSIRARATHAPQPWSAATAETPQAQLQTPPGPPQILSPVGFVRPFGAAPGWLILQWVHATLDQSAQTAAEARFSLDGGTTWRALSLAGMVNVSGNTWQVNLPQSLVPWALGSQLAIQMRTRGNHPGWGAWSDAAFSTPTLEASAAIVGPTPTPGEVARTNIVLDPRAVTTRWRGGLSATLSRDLITRTTARRTNLLRSPRPVSGLWRMNLRGATGTTTWPGTSPPGPLGHGYVEFVTTTSATSSPINIYPNLYAAGDAPPVIPGQQITVLAVVRQTGSATRAFRVDLSLFDAGGAVIRVPGDTVTLPDGQWYDYARTFTVPAGAASLRGVITTFSGPQDDPVGTAYAVAGVIAEAGPTGGGFFDGDTPDTATHTHAWTGEPHMSPSTQTFDDSPALPDGTQVGTYARFVVQSIDRIGNVTIGTDAPGMAEAGRTLAGSFLVRSSHPLIGATIRIDGPRAIMPSVGPTIPAGEWHVVDGAVVTPDDFNIHRFNLNLRSTDLVVGQVIDVTAAILEVAEMAQPFFDGNTLSTDVLDHEWTGARHDSRSVQRFLPAPVSFTSSTISIARVNLEWAFLPGAPGDVLTQTVVEVYQGNSTAPENLIWEGTFGAGVTATTLPQILSNGQQVTVSLRVRGSNGFWSSWVQRTFTADFVPPQQIRFHTTFDEEQGTVTLTGLPEGPGIAPDRMTILRATAHGPEEPLQWVALAVNIPISETFVDRYPPLNAMVVYNMTAVAPVPGTDEYTTAASTDRGALILSGKSPICANSRELARWQQRFGGGPDFPVFPIYYTQSMWLDAGLGFQQRVRGFYNLTISQNIGVVGGSTNYFSGQSWPRHYGGFERTHQVSFSFRVELLNRYPRGGQRNNSATPVSEQPGTALSHLIDWQRFFLVARVVVYRDHLGNYFMAHLQPGSVSEVGLGILEISASVTRVMHLRAPAAGLSPGLPGVQAQAAALGASMMQAPTGLSGATEVASAGYGDLGQYPDGWTYGAEDVIAEGLPSLYPGDAGYEWNGEG